MQLKQTTQETTKNTVKTQEIDAKQITFIPLNKTEESHDGRKRINNAFEYPFYNIGYLYIQFNRNGQILAATATATLISHNVIITAASNIFLKQENIEAHNVKFFQGLNGQKHLARNINVRKPYIYPKQYPKSQKNEFDSAFAFLVLQQQAQNKIVPLPIIVDYPQTDNQIGIYGYPQDKIVSDSPNVYMYGCKGKYTLNKDNLWNYDIPTYLGMGGSALIVFLENDKLGVIGVHVATSRFKKQRIGARLTTEKLKLINQQMQQKFNQQINFYKIE